MIVELGRLRQKHHQELAQGQPVLYSKAGLGYVSLVWLEMGAKRWGVGAGKVA